MQSTESTQTTHKIKTPKNLSPRIQWLRDYYFKGVDRAWNNEFTAFTTGTPWDIQYNELTYYIVPENYSFFQAMTSSFKQTAHPVKLPAHFWKLSLPERVAWFNKQVMVNYLPQEILPGDLIAGGRFNVYTSFCLTEKQAEQRQKLLAGKHGSREQIKWFHYKGYGNCGATCGHLIPDHQKALQIGWKGIHAELNSRYQALSQSDQNSPKGKQLQAMMISATLPKELSEKYATLCNDLSLAEKNEERKTELQHMARNLQKVPWEPAETFWEAVQALWLNHMLIMSDENYPGPGVSFGRIDQYLLPYWKQSIANGMTRDFGKEILKCFWMHTNTAYDAIIRTGGNQGITSGYGQLITLSGLGKDDQDMTNDLTYILLEVIDEMSPILEPKPNIRLHQGSPDRLLDKVVDMIATSQGAPFLLNFDERSMAGMMREANKSNSLHLIHENNVYEYSPVGCLENTMVGNDRSGTVDNNLDLLKAIELTLTGGKDLLPYADPITGKQFPIKQDGCLTSNARYFTSFEQFFRAFKKQLAFIIQQCVETYEASEFIRSQFHPTPYLSCLVKGCAEKGLDITQGGAELSFTTINPIGFATTIDSLLAIKYLVFDERVCTMKELINALKANWNGFEVLQATAKYKAPKYGRDDHDADALGKKVMDIWTEEVWKHQTKSTQRQFRPGLLSWNYWVEDGYILPASPDGRPCGKFLSNAICPSTGADIYGPTANTNSVGNVLGGRTQDKNQGDWRDYKNSVPSGASHTITFNPSFLKDKTHKEKFKAFLKGYTENGGTALQINMLDPDMLRDAQKHPQDYRHLLVRITGYNAYFTSIGKELQDEVIARLMHGNS
ncbi:MAG: hypothetical protein HQK77_08985 [Desulfobacterales bacterium]|nr:hypothetical protein [Desulfobacterales bacterium]